MISKFGKELIASGIPEDVVKRAYDFIEKANIGKGLVGKDAELCRSFKDFAAMQLHISLVLENKKKEYLKS